MKTKGKILASFLFMASATGAHANAFNLDQGDGRVIISSFFTASPKQFDDNGHVVNAPDYNQFNIYVNGEYGLTDKLNLIVSPSFRSIQIEGPDNDSVGLGYTDLGLRYQIAKGSNWVVGGQGLVRIPGTGRDVGIAQIGNQDAQFDLRGVAGLTFGQTFVNAEAGYRFRTGRPPNEIHADLTVGTHVTPKLMVLGSVQNTISDGRGSARPFSIGGGQTFNYNYAYRYHDVSLSAVYALSPRFSLQAGATATVAGRNALRQRGPFVGLWYRF